jgi:hypothetical protein
MAKRKSCTWVTRLADWVFRCLVAHSIISAHFAIKAHLLPQPYGSSAPVAQWDSWAVTGLGKLYIWIITEGGQRLGFRGNLIYHHAALFIVAVYTLAFVWPLVVRLLFVPFCQQAEIRRNFWFQGEIIKPNKPW